MTLACRDSAKGPAAISRKADAACHSHRDNQKKTSRDASFRYRGNGPHAASSFGSGTVRTFSTEVSINHASRSERALSELVILSLRSRSLRPRDLLLRLGGQSVFNFPRAESEPERTRVERTMGLWGILMGGFMQFLTGVWLLTGLSWFPVFVQAPSAYMAGLAFTAYGVHWFAIGYRRYRDASAMPEAWMTIAFAWLSLIGVIAFLVGGDVLVAIVFVLLTLIYVSEMIGRFGHSPIFLKLQGVFQLINGIWLMYLTLAFALAFADGVKLWM